MTCEQCRLQERRDVYYAHKILFFCGKLHIIRPPSPLDHSDANEITRREAEKQENLANELFGMARLMKQTYTTAGAVIKEDNATLSRLQQAADSHKGSLLRESKRLEEYAYRSWCDLLYIIGICAIIMSFISMVLVMRVFTKKY
ncbi:unnamed protein product [Gongylonema pulchrum]|uniref:Vesicle transport protein USE1 n=1 Tax=Gongylonema pulchrum TaxID=637853 RepID=A0A183EPE6_9BILA|nr:unnamed protein product [Gongylonema pulchrum]